MDVADELMGELSTDFARRHFIELGFVIAESFRFPPINLGIAIIGRQPLLAAEVEVNAAKRKPKVEPEWAEIADVEWSTKPLEFARDREMLLGHGAWPSIKPSVEHEADKILFDIRKDENDSTPLTTRLVERVDCIETYEIVKALVARYVVCWCAARHRNKNVVEEILGYPARPPRRKRRPNAPKGEQLPP